MFCSDCGRQAEGKFCCHCGAALARSPATSGVERLEPVPIDWEDSLDYEIVRDAPEVRSAIERAEAAFRQGPSGAQYLQIVDSVATTFTGGVSSIAIAKLVQPLYAKWGLKTQKEHSERFALKPGRALAGVLIALSRRGRSVLDARNESQACVVTAALPADLRSLDGKLFITVRPDLAGSQVTAQARIDGQWLDWGKCRHGIDQLFADVRQAG